tara:strand:- start:8027 stop:8131 length:105 start_codon:yes stop_codon:yes gene_type:complete
MISKTNGRIWKLEVAVEELKKEIESIKKNIKKEG